MQIVRGNFYNRNSARKWLAWITAATLTIQLVIPGGFSFDPSAPKAQATGKTWDFNGTYLPGVVGGSPSYSVNNAAIQNGHAQSLVHWTNASSGLPATSIIKLSDSSGGVGNRTFALTASVDPYYSTDYGDTWTSGPICGLAQQAMTRTDLFTSRTDRSFISGTGAISGTSVIRYQNDGAADNCWTDVTTQPGGTNAYKMSQDGLGTLYVGTGNASARIYSSADNGANWSAWGSAITGPTIVYEAKNFASTYMYAATNSDVWGSTDGTIWTNLTNNALDYRELEWDIDGYIWAMTSTGAIYKSTSAGGGAVAFASVSTAGVTGTPVSLLADENVSGHTYIGTSSGLVYRQVAGSTGWTMLEVTSLSGQPGDTYTSVLAILRYIDGSDGAMLIGGYTGSAGQVSRGWFFDDVTASADIPTIQNTANDTVPFTEVQSFTVNYTLYTQVSAHFQVSNDGTTWYWYKPVSGWTAVTGNNPSFAESTDETTVDTNISTFDDVVGTGSFYFRIIMQSSTPATTYPQSQDIVIDSIDITYTEADSITITNPTSADSYTVDDSDNITWSATGAGDHVRILLYRNAGGTLVSTLVDDGAALAPGVGTWAWTIGNVPLDTDYTIVMQLRSAANATLATDTSDQFPITFGAIDNFSTVIPATGTDGEAFAITVTARDQFNNTITDFNTSGGGTTTLTLNTVSGSGSGAPANINDNTFASGVATPNYTITGTGTFTITATHAGQTGTSSASGQIAIGSAASITVGAPNGGETWFINHENSITWSAVVGDADHIKISLSSNGGSSYGTVITSSTDTTSPYIWMIPDTLEAKSTYRIKLELMDVSNVVLASDTSDANFSIEREVEQDPDNTPPVSKVTPLEPYKTTSTFEIYATASDDKSGIAGIQLWYRKADQNTYTFYGNGEYDYDSPESRYVWTFDSTTTGGNGTYYFYSIAIDNAANFEDAPTSADTFTVIDTNDPWIIATNPRHQETNVGIHAQVRAYFSETIEISTFEYTLNPLPLGGVTTSWEQTNDGEPSVFVITPNEQWDPSTLFTVHITKAYDTAGHALTSGPVSNPWGFTTAAPSNPDLYGSEITVDDYIVQPGQLLHYTIKLRNTSSTRATISMTNLLPDQATEDSRANDLEPLELTPEYIKENNVVTKLYWARIVMDGNSEKTITYSLRLKTNLPRLTQVNNVLQIDDSVHAVFERNALSIVGSQATFGGSTMTVDKNLAHPGDTLLYTLTAVNGGDENATNVVITDPIPAYTTFDPSYPIEGGAVFDGTRIAWLGDINAGSSHTIVFRVIVNSNAHDVNVVNTATITHESKEWKVSRTTFIDDQLEPLAPPRILSITPPDGAPEGYGPVGLYAPISVKFSNTMKRSSVTWTITSLGETLDASAFVPEWDSASKELTLTHPTLPFYQYSQHEITINGSDEQGNSLVAGDIPNPSTFTTILPGIVFTEPAYPGQQKKAGQPHLLTIKLIDKISGQNYSVEKEGGMTFALRSSSSTGAFDLTAGGKFDGSFDSVSLAKGENTTSFYFKDNVPSAPYEVALGVTEEPPLGWVDALTSIILTKDEVEQPSLGIYFASTQQNILVNTYSQPITVEFRNNKGDLVNMPGGTTLHFHSTSPTGLFYKEVAGQKIQLGFYIKGDFQAQGGFDQYLKLAEPSSSATVYYNDPLPGSYLLTVSAPDTSFQPGQQIMNVLSVKDLEEEEPKDELLKELELEEVVDDTGREIDRIEIAPATAVLNLQEQTTFQAIAYDKEGLPIENAVFSWFVVNGGGSILEHGSTAKAHATTFTAGAQVGEYNQTVLAATLYNGQLRASSASVIVVDLSDFAGHLPSTGPNQLQLFFLAIAMVAGVALAAVESYEKKLISKMNHEAHTSH